MFSMKEIEEIFQTMGLGTSFERDVFLNMVPSELEEEPQIFIRFDAWTESEDTHSHAQLG